MTEFGHHAIRAGDREKSVRVFEVCDRVFPDVAEIVVSLGFAWLEAGERGRAEALANKALRLKPEMADATEILELVAMGRLPALDCSAISVERSIAFGAEAEIR